MSFQKVRKEFKGKISYRKALGFLKIMSFCFFRSFIKIPSYFLQCGSRILLSLLICASCLAACSWLSGGFAYFSVAIPDKSRNSASKCPAVSFLLHTTLDSCDVNVTCTFHTHHYALQSVSRVEILSHIREMLNTRYCVFIYMNRAD